MQKRLPVGVSDFKEMIEGEYYYIDKTLLIKEIIDSGAKVLQFPRPRRFGKTLNLSMLRYFFEKSLVTEESLFTGLEIARSGERYMQEFGEYPVIYLTFKDIKDSDWASAFRKIQRIIIDEYERHGELLHNGGQLTRMELDFYESIISKEASPDAYENSLRYLSRFLWRVYEKKVIILIDEYDAPIQCGYMHGYYEKVIPFMRNFLGSGLKDNLALEKGVLTGILRVARESIFSGLNNLSVYGIFGEQFDRHFGLLEDEVAAFLQVYELDGRLCEVKDWYNGYRFGAQTIYNPWSIIKYIENRGIPHPYWVNTSSNDLVRQLITRSGTGVKRDLEVLIAGGTVEKQIYEDITFGEIEDNAKTIWSFLLFSGYLRASVERREQGRVYCELSIPNREVQYIYEEIVLNWFENAVCDEELELLLRSLLEGDLHTFQAILQNLVNATLSYFDVGGQNPEKFYHAFVLGLLVNLRKEYQVKSNRESGYGRYDVMLIPHDVERAGVVLEFKRVEAEESLEAAAESALRQIGERAYCEELHALHVRRAVLVGVAFTGKRVLVRGRVGGDG